MSEAKYVLQNSKNYHNTLENPNTSFYFNKYIDLAHQYLLYSAEHIFIRDKEYSVYVMQKGIEGLLNIYTSLLLYTKNFELSYYHSQKAYYYYIEFISQIGNESHSFLKLNAKDALLFVYRKTIFEVDNEVRKNLQENEEDHTWHSELYKCCREFSDIIKYQLLYSDILQQKNDQENKKNEVTTSIPDEEVITQEKEMHIILERNHKMMKEIFNHKDVLQFLVFDNKLIELLSQHFDVTYVMQTLHTLHRKRSAIECVENLNKDIQWDEDHMRSMGTPLKMVNYIIQKINE